MLIRCLACAISLSVLCMGCANTSSGKGCGYQCPETAKPAKILRHVVIFKFKDTAKPADIKAVVDAFRALPSKIKTIKSFEWGTNVSSEKLDKGFTHCFFLTFADVAGRDAYLPHPAHKEFGETLKGRLDQAFVIDYWTQK